MGERQEKGGESEFSSNRCGKTVMTVFIYTVALMVNVPEHHLRLPAALQTVLCILAASI